MIRLSEDSKKRNKQLEKWIAKKEAIAKKDKEKVKKKADEKRKKQSALDKMSRSGNFVIANTASTLIEEVEEYVKKHYKGMKNISDLLMFYEEKSGKASPQVYADWMTRQHYFSLLNEKIKKPDKRIALGLAIAFNLKDNEFSEFVEMFGYSFPTDKRDYVVLAFINSSYYNTRTFSEKKYSKQEILDAQYSQTNYNINAVNSVISSYDPKLEPIWTKRENAK